MQGQPIQLLEWSRLYEDTPARTVGREEIGEKTVVTMWLGHDEDYWMLSQDERETERPRIFGTATFARAGGLIRETRSHDIEEARKIHQDTVQHLREQEAAS